MGINDKNIPSYETSDYTPDDSSDDLDDFDDLYESPENSSEENLEDNQENMSEDDPEDHLENNGANDSEDDPVDGPEDNLENRLQENPEDNNLGYIPYNYQEDIPEDYHNPENSPADSLEYSPADSLENSPEDNPDENPENFPNRLLIINGEIVNHDERIKADIYIEDGIIKEIGQYLRAPESVRTIDAKDKYILPGGIDPHTHFEMEFAGTKSVDDFYHGTKAAVAGGTTMIFDFVFPQQGESLVDCYHAYRNKADGKVCCDYGLHVCLTSWSEEVKREVEVLAKEYGVNSFKTFMAYAFMLNDSQLYSAFEHCKNLGALPMVHAENGSIIDKLAEKLIAQGVTGPEGHEPSRPEDVEAEAVNRACLIAKYADCPLYIAHIMSKAAAQVVELYRKNKQPVFAETLAAALATDGSHCKVDSFNHAAGYVTSPPLRSDPSTPLYLMHCLKRNVIDITASDNCTFTKAQKEIGKDDFRNIPHGVNGVEDRMSIVWDRGVHKLILDPKEFVAVTSTNAAKIFNIYPRKGHITVGSDADIVIWDAGSRTISAETHHQAVDFNIFEGMLCFGVPEYVIVNGRVCVDNRQLNVIEGLGRYIESPLHSAYVYNPENIRDVMPEIDILVPEPEQQPGLQIDVERLEHDVHQQLLGTNLIRHFWWQSPQIQRQLNVQFLQDPQFQQQRSQLHQFSFQVQQQHPQFRQQHPQFRQYHPQLRQLRPQLHQQRPQQQIYFYYQLQHPHHYRQQRPRFYQYQQQQYFHYRHYPQQYLQYYQLEPQDFQPELPQDYQFEFPQHYQPEQPQNPEDAQDYQPEQLHYYQQELNQDYQLEYSPYYQRGTSQLYQPIQYQYYYGQDYSTVALQISHAGEERPEFQINIIQPTFQIINNHIVLQGDNRHNEPPGDQSSEF